MKIKFEKDILVFWPENEIEEKTAEGVRHVFDLASYKSDRVWNKKQAKNKKPLGVRIYLLNKLK